MQLTVIARELGALMMPGDLSRTYCIFDAGVHPAVIAWITPKGTYCERKQRAKQNAEKKGRRKGLDGKQTGFIKNQHTGGGVLVPQQHRFTLPPRGGWSRQSKEQKQNTRFNSPSSLRRRRQVLPSSRGRVSCYVGYIALPTEPRSHVTAWASG